jgi:hypothetical protein
MGTIEIERELAKVVTQREKTQAQVAILAERERTLRVRAHVGVIMEEPKTLEEEKQARRLAFDEREERRRMGEIQRKQRELMQAVKNAHPPQGRPRKDEGLLDINNEIEFNGVVYKVQGYRLHRSIAGVETWYYKLRDAEHQKAPIFVTADEVTRA